MTQSKPLPAAPAPTLSVETQHGEWTLSVQRPDNFTLVVFYRGLHCPICRGQLEDINKHLPKLTERGVDAIAVSMDDKERWKKVRETWKISDVTLGHSLDEETARAWGLYISAGIKENEPDIFSEPGLFLVRPDGTIYFASIQSMPFTRPPLNQLIGAIDYALEHDYPARGERP